MIVSLPELVRQIRDLRSLQVRLVSTMRSAAATLQSQGRPPAVGLMDDLTTYRRWFGETRVALETKPCTANNGVESLDGLEQSLQLVQSLHSAGGVLDRVLKLDHSRAEQRAVLNPVQQLAQRLRTQLQTPDADSEGVVTALNNRTHPLTVLLTLVEQQDAISDADWERALETVRTAFGPDVAAAAARKRLVIRD